MNRYLLGYDLRACARDYVSTAWRSERRRQYLLNGDVDWPLSVDTTVWPSLFHFTSRRGDYRPVEMIDVDPLSNDQLVLRLWSDVATMDAKFREKATRPVCFVRIAVELWDHGDAMQTLPWALVAESLSRNRNAVPDWEAVGFDVADSDFVSGLTNCGYKEHERIEMTKWTRTLNKFGLFDDIERAEEFRRLSDDRVPEHAPFFAYRLFADRERQK